MLKTSFLFFKELCHHLLIMYLVFGKQKEDISEGCFSCFFPQYTESQWCPKQNIFNICVLQKKIIKQVCNIHVITFIRRFYPKRLTIAFRLYIFISMCVPWESNPQPFALLTQCSTTEPHRST